MTTHPMPRNFKLTIAYDGARYLGWQKTAIGSTIEENLQAVLEQILQHPVQLQAASRTDAGVHAHGQIVNFFSDRKQLPSLNTLRMSINRLLPKDIVVFEMEEMRESFHPTLDCIGKEYRYTISTGPSQTPQMRFYAWHCHYILDVSSMRKGAEALIGVHDFAAFCNLKKSNDYKSTVREVTSIDLLELSENTLQLIIKGNHFLYKMVRNIVGTLAYIGRGKLHFEDIPHIFKGLTRAGAGITAPAHGLTLHKVYY